LLQTFFLALSLSADAFAASVAKGVRYPQMSLGQTVAIATGFAVLEALAPLVGFLLGQQFASVIENYDHWIAFGILAALGLRMLHRSFQPQDFRQEAGPGPGIATVFATALGTSIDATAVGLTLALISANIPLTLLMIAVVTFLATLIGLRLGGTLGTRAGVWAERAGGLGLIAIGSTILHSHLVA
jgi:putative Mn2+ efflux pump MntP